MVVAVAAVVIVPVSLLVVVAVAGAGSCPRHRQLPLLSPYPYSTLSGGIDKRREGEKDRKNDGKHIEGRKTAMATVVVVTNY